MTIQSSVWIFFSVVVLGLAAAVPIHRSDTLQVRNSQPSIVRQVGAQNHCVIDGNSDLYGLGIRLGVYLQWITSLIANHHSHESIRSNLETNTLFLGAIFVAAIVATAQDGLKSAEILIFLHLCYGSIFSILSIWGYRIRSQAEGTIRFPVAGSAFRLILISAISIYSVWCWFSGIKRAAIDGCSTYTFIFYRLNVGPRVEAFFQTQSVVIVAIFAGLSIFEVMVLMWHLVVTVLKSRIKAEIVIYFSPLKKRQPEKMGVLYKLQLWLYSGATSFWSLVNADISGFNRPPLVVTLVPLVDAPLLALRSGLQYICLLLFKRCPPMGFPPLPPVFGNDSVAALKMRISIAIRSRKSAHYFYAFNALCLAWAIVSIEVILVWNHIQGVYTVRTTGQLIPFVIGITSLLSLMQKISVRRSWRGRTEILMALIDRTPKWARKELDPPNLRSSIECEHRGESLVYTLGNGRKADFLLQKPRRRHSFSSISRAQHTKHMTLSSRWSGPNEVELSEEWRRSERKRVRGLGTSNSRTPLADVNNIAVAYESPPSDQNRSVHEQDVDDVNTDNDEPSNNILSRADTLKDTYKGSGFRVLAAVFAVFLFFLRAATQPLAFLDRISLISGRTAFARKEFRRQQTEHFREITYRLMVKYSKTIDLQSGESTPEVDRLDPPSEDIATYEQNLVMWQSIWQSMRQNIQDLDPNQTYQKLLAGFLKDSGFPEDLFDIFSSMGSKNKTATGNQLIEGDWDKSYTRLVLKNAMINLKRAWQSHSAYAVAMTLLCGLRDLFDTFEPATFQRSRDLCEPAIWALEDVRRIRKWKRRGDITMEMQHILLQDWLEEGALKEFWKAVCEEGQRFVAGYLAVFFGDYAEMRAPRRHSI